MTTLREAAQQALEALEEVQKYGTTTEWFDERVSALRAALAERVQEPVWVCPDSAEHRYGKPGHCEDCGKTLVQVAEPVQKPVPSAWRYKDTARICDNSDKRMTAPPGWVPLYSAPPQRKPLTEEEIDELSRTMVKGNKSVNWLCRAVEQAHGIT